MTLAVTLLYQIRQMQCWFSLLTYVYLIDQSLKIVKEKLTSPGLMLRDQYINYGLRFPAKVTSLIPRIHTSLP